MEDSEVSPGRVSMSEKFQVGCSKRPVHILYICLGIEEAHNTYSKDGHAHTVDELFEHLV